MSAPSIREIAVTAGVLAGYGAELRRFLLSLKRQSDRHQRARGLGQWFTVKWPAAVSAGRTLRPVVIIPAQRVLDAAAAAKAMGLDARGVHGAAGSKQRVVVGKGHGAMLARRAITSKRGGGK